MRIERKTLLQLVLFFSKNQDALPVIAQCPSDPEVWEKIFVFYYGEPPVHTVSESYPLKRRPGSTDPRWDELLHKRRALQAMSLYLRRRLVIYTTKESA